MHAVFVRMDGVEVDVEPAVGYLTPDFRIRSSGTAAYVEAKVLLEPGAEALSEARQASILDSLSSLRTTDVILDVSFVSEGDTTPGLSALRREIQAWIDGLDADELLGGWQPGSAQRPSVVSREFRADDWTPRVAAIPRSRDRRVQSEGFHIGPGRGRMVNDHDAIRKAFIEKAGRYRGKLDAPLVPAIYNGRWTADEHETALALCGVAWEHPEMMASAHIPGSWRDVPEGMWITRDGAQYQEIVSALSGHWAGPYGLSLTELTIWYPPWGHFEWLQSPYLGFREPDSEGRLVATPPALPLRDLLGLPADWPKQDG